jgi:hypothetical protein
MGTRRGGATVRGSACGDRGRRRKGHANKTDLEPTVVRSLEDNAHAAELRLVESPTLVVIGGALREAIAVVAVCLHVCLPAAGAACGEVAEIEQVHWCGAGRRGRTSPRSLQPGRRVL